LLELRLNAEDVRAIDKIVEEVSERYESVESPEFQRESRLYADELPRRVRALVGEYRLSEAHGALVVSGLRVDDSEIGPTPAHWANKPTPSPTLRHDVAFFLISCLLGEPIAWATQQDGYTMHDILPIKGHEKEQIGSGSEELLTWHTEDAYHPLRTDYLGLMCMRNPDNVETTMADVADVKVSESARKILSEKRFLMLPDHSHRATNQGSSADEDPRVVELRARSYAQVEHALSNPEPAAILFGSPESPYLRLDPAFMPELPEGEEKDAFDEVCAAIDDAMGEVVLQPGDIVFVDNYRMVHGRKPFRARFDGTDRWLRRLNIARDLRKSRGNRLSAESRVIF
jgi:enduracididine beta-hydroxylase